MTVGPYRPIHLLSYTARILDLHVSPTVSPSLVATIGVGISLRGNLNEAVATQVTLKDSAGKLLRSEEVKLEPGLGGTERRLLRWTFRSDEVKLWWPVGYGSQTLYSVEVKLLGDVCESFFSIRLNHRDLSSLRNA